MHRTQELSLQSQLQSPDSNVEAFQLFTGNANLPQEPPPPIVSAGLDKERQWYLYKNIRQYVLEPWQDVMCPLPKEQLGLTQLTRKSLNVHWLEWTPTFLSSSRRRPCNLLETLTVLISRLVEGGVVGELLEKVVVEENQRLSVLRIIMPCNLLETLTVLMSRLGEVEIVVEEKKRLSVLRILITCT